ncbi:MAG: Uncharacterised protein [Owenweeksia sp. TMED14]|nr:MAG: Uncharacterised protein [Owenweeksia sp. TMED14]|tara:strand:+ start:23224 stop:24603 length:1380 start_codon:yes stop_codon:yes gene_type:complete
MRQELKKQNLSFFQIWNMSFGFLGIQFGFALQGGFMSRIFQNLGATEEEIPMLWIAAPLTGLIVQPIIGYLSDNTWSPRWGRRRPFFLIGAILSSITLLFIPHSPALWIAAGALWVLDASINISMEPFRALVADKLPESQRSYGFVIQTLIIGIGTWVASSLPLLMSSLGVSNVSHPGEVPLSIKVAFAIGSLIFLLAILYTVFTTKEYPPEDLEEFNRIKKEKIKSSNLVIEVFNNLRTMPITMRKLGLVQFFSWFAFFSMWSLATPALTDHVFKSPKPNKIEWSTSTAFEKKEYEVADRSYNDAADEVGAYMGYYGLSSMLFALLLTFYTSRKRINRKYLHMFSLIAGGIGFLSMYWIKDSSMLFFSFALIGISWGSILSMPYAMLSSFIDPNKMGLFMGIFNMFIVLPQILAAKALSSIYQIIGPGAIHAMVLAGICLLLAAGSMILITDKKAIQG